MYIALCALPDNLPLVLTVKCESAKEGATTMRAHFIDLISIYREAHGASRSIEQVTHTNWDVCVMLHDDIRFSVSAAAEPAKELTNELWIYFFLN